MVTRRRFLVLVGAGGGVAAAVATGVLALPGGDASEDGFPTIRYGAEACADCGMVIDDARYAAAWAPRGSARGGRHFDDIGCLLNNLTKHPAPEGARFFVHDYQTEAWLPAAGATYLVSTAIRSPMAYGIAAAATHEAAERLAVQYAQQGAQQGGQQGARVQPWAALLSAPVKGHA